MQRYSAQAVFVQTGLSMAWHGVLLTLYVDSVTQRGKAQDAKIVQFILNHIQIAVSNNYIDMSLVNAREFLFSRYNG